MQMGQDILGKTVISLDTGKTLGQVKDLYFDAAVKNLVALYLGHEGLLSRKRRIVRFAEIAVLGEDAILVKSVESVEEKNRIDGAEAWVSRSELHGRKVTTTGSTPIGRIDDITLGDNGMVMDFTLLWTQIGGPIGERQLVARRAVTDPGNDIDVMQIDLAVAEQSEAPSAA